MANPRSPESGDVPENTPDWVQEQIEAAQRRTREYPDHFESPPVMRRYDKALVWLASVWNATRTANGALSARVDALTAELSTARERADRAEQDSKRLDELEAARLELRLRVDPDEMIQVDVSRRGDDEVLQEYTLRDAADALMVSTPTPTPDDA